MFSVVYCAQINLQRNVAAARLMFNKWQWIHIDKVGNGQNLLPVDMKLDMPCKCMYTTSNCVCQVGGLHT